MKDQFCRNINYMRISITDLCNLRCVYCMPEEGTCKKEHIEMITFEEIVEVVKASAKLGIDKIRITGGEPLVKRDIVKFVNALSEIKEIKDIAMTTNGTLLKKYAEDLKKAGLKRLNISIDSLQSDRYREITRGGDVTQVLEGIQEVIRLGMTPVKLNVVVIGGYNEDEINDFANLTLEDPIDVRFIELMPIGQAADWAKDKFISNEEIKKRIGRLIPLVTEASSPAKYYKIPGAKGRVGFINPISNHFCEECNRIRLTSDGKLKPCLHSNEEVELLKILKTTPDKIPQVLESAIKSKPLKHNLNTEEHEFVLRNMSQIGG